MTIQPDKLLENKDSLELDGRTCIMGILNVTPDSFSDGGRFFNQADAVAHGEKIVKEGADIIDIGGESTRPFSAPISAEEESRRVIPVIEKLAKKVSVPISIDTTKACVAKRAIEAGASIINDVSALRFDHKMADVAAEYGVPVILMHLSGTPCTMQVSPDYGNVVREIKDFLEDAVKRAEQKGIIRSQIIIDPGLGFGKTVEHNLVIINRLDEFKTLDLPILIGPSRKAFIRNIIKNNKIKNLNPDDILVETGTAAAVAAAVLHGANIVRVHDVPNAWAALKIIDAIKNVSDYPE